MPRNTDGEFELILGNKQLLSLFFLVVVLFAVFFSLGYMVGRSISPTPTLAAQPSSGATPASNAPTPGQPAEPPKEALPSQSAEPAPAPTETQPASSEPVAASNPTSAQPSKPGGESPAKEETGQSSTSAAVIAREMHLQLAAVRVRADAEVMVENLRKKGYPVVLHSDARDGWYRVLAGPFANEQVAKEMKAMLERDGYKSILKKP